MNAYPDTSFLFSLYLPQIHSARAAEYFAAMHEPLGLTSLNRFELANAIQMALFRKTIPATRADDGMRALADDLEVGAVVLAPCDWVAVHARALQIALEHTVATGCRGMDVLHVATALELGAAEILTFDTRQAALAKAAGLKLPVAL